MSKEHEEKMEIMMAQLLFSNKPQAPSADRVRAALEKYLGTLGDVPSVEPSKEPNNGELFMFPLEKYKVTFQDAPDGMPVMATYMASNAESGIEIDDMKRTQLWDVPNGNDIIDACKYTVLVSTMLGAALPYRDQAEILLAQVGAALDCYPDCIGIYVYQSGKLITPEMFNADKKYDLSTRFIKMFVNVRFFNITNTEEMVVDTLGFNVFGGADVQVHFKNMDPNNVVNYVYNIASYQFENDFPIESGETIDSIDQNGDMQKSPQWRTQYENSLIGPDRIVLDINCGEYAGGDRE